MELLKRAWHGWKSVAKKIGDFQARIILALFYFVILSPFSLIMRAKDPLEIRPSSVKGWHARGQDEIAAMDRAFRQW
jgi:hypothetical protein